LSWLSWGFEFEFWIYYLRTRALLLVIVLEDMRGIGKEMEKDYLSEDI